MPDVLRLSVDDTRVHRLATPEAVLDPSTAIIVQQAVEVARTEARAEGEAAGRAAAREEHRLAAEGVAAALQQVRADLAERREESVRASLRLARAVATAVLDRTPPPDALDLLDRVHEAVALLDDAPLRIQVGPQDAEALDAVRLGDGLVLEVDASLRPGEARVAGGSSGVELTRDALVDAALELLGQEAS